jgi:hypothetical protein
VRWPCQLATAAQRAAERLDAHRLTGRRDITEATRPAGRAVARPFKILNLNVIAILRRPCFPRMASIVLDVTFSDLRDVASMKGRT